MIKKEQVEIIDIIYEEMCCDNCGEPMQQTPVVYTTYPAQYEYICPKCKIIQSSYTGNYPRLVATFSNGKKRVL